METKRPKLSLRRRGDSVTTIGYALINECGHEIPGVIAVRDTGERDGYGTPIFDIKIAAEIVLD